MRKPLKKKVRIQRLVTPCVLPCWCFTLKNHYTKKIKEEASEDAKILAKRMKEVRGKHLEQIAKRRGLSSLRAPAAQSETSQKRDVLRATNKIRHQEKKKDVDSKKKPAIANFGENVQKLGPLCVAGGKVKRCSHYRK